MKAALLLACVLASFYLTCGTLLAGVAKLDGTLPDASGVGVPLAGYNHGDRRYSLWPLPQTGLEYCNWMNPSTGVWSPTWIKALVLQADDGTMFAFVTTDTIGMAGSLADLAWDIAASQGLKVPRANVIMSGAHTHSGPGLVAPDFLWAIAPATDLMVPKMQRKFANTVANALLQAQNAMQPAKMGIGKAFLAGVTRNRRAGISRFVQYGTIDPHLGVVRVDKADGTVMATVWNYATHGTCFGPSNMKFSGDIMGYTCDVIEQTIGGTAMFINADAGDVAPTPQACVGVPKCAGSSIIAAAVVKERASQATFNDVKIQVYSQIVPFGLTSLNMTLQRFDNCTSGGPLDICSICEILRCDLDLHLDEAWLEQNPRFTAVSFELGGKTTLMVTLPGEPLVELGWQVYNDTLKMGFDNTFLCGYSNNHMGYFATPNEYDIGGYESQLTFWGRETAEKVRASCSMVASKIKPAPKPLLALGAERQ